MDNISSKILSFYMQLEKDENHRYKSWEHCYAYFTGKNLDIKIACLQMSFYLASWGMYRGSSFLLWKDYLIHKKVVEHIINNKHLQRLDFTQTTKADIEDIFNLITWIKNWYKNNVGHINGKVKKVNVTDTLATKIILGTLGCVPAYDRYFVYGLRAKGLSYSNLNPRNFKSLIVFYNNNVGSFNRAGSRILKKSGIKYPSMKLVDMYFWKIGFEMDQYV